MMKILFQNRKRNSWIGGDYVQLDATAEALRKLGVDVTISDESVVSPEEIVKYDIVHLWNFSMPWTKYQMWVARKHKKPVVCSMIYHEGEQFIPYSMQQVMLDELSAAFFLTDGEVERVKRHLTIKDEIIHVIPNGIDQDWLIDDVDFLPIEPFILTVGRVETNKGQLAVAKACKELGITYICIGEKTEPLYAAKCEEEGAILYGKMTKQELKPYYKSAKGFILASAAEVYPLTVMEASSQGTPVILTIMCEWNAPFIRCEHDNVESIKEAIKQLPDTKDFTFAKTMKTWDNIALEIKEQYELIYGR